jgi:hypothetical protein
MAFSAMAFEVWWTVSCEAKWTVRKKKGINRNLDISGLKIHFKWFIGANSMLFSTGLVYFTGKSHLCSPN